MKTNEELIAAILDDEGYETVEECLEHSMLHDCPGACRECGFTIMNIEPDSVSGYCEGCGANAIVSIQELALY